MSNCVRCKNNPKADQSLCVDCRLEVEEEFEPHRVLARKIQLYFDHFDIPTDDHITENKSYWKRGFRTFYIYKSTDSSSDIKYIGFKEGFLRIEFRNGKKFQEPVLEEDEQSMTSLCSKVLNLIRAYQEYKEYKEKNPEEEQKVN